MSSRLLSVSISAASSGDNTVVAALSGAVIRVIQYTIVAAGAVVATWKQGSTAVSGAMSLITGVPVSAEAPPRYPGSNAVLFQTAAGAALVLNLGGAVQVSGHMVVEISSQTP